jgi:hypothetical protein
MKYWEIKLFAANVLSDQKYYTLSGNEVMKSDPLKPVPHSDFWNQSNFYKSVNAN